MRATSIILLPLFAAAMCYAASLEQSGVIQLTNPEDIKDASTMDRAIAQLSEKVMECTRRKLTPAGECFCLYPPELARVRNTYEGTTKQHPDWKNKIVSYSVDGRTHAISLAGLNRQLQTKCPEGK